MANVMMLWEHPADDGSLSASTGWTTELPAANLQTEQLTEVARSNTLTPVIVLDLGRIMAVNTVALLRHTMSLTGTWQIEGSRVSNFATKQLDIAPSLIWPCTVTNGTRPWGAFPWNGRQQTQDGAIGLATFDTVFIRYLRVPLDDSARGDGITNIDAARLMVDCAWRASINMQYDWKLRWVDPSIKARSRGGTMWGERRRKYREIEFDLAFLQRDEMWGTAYEVDQDRGLTGNVLVVVDSDDLVHRHRQAIYGTMAELGDIEQPYHERFNKSFYIEENR